MAAEETITISKKVYDRLTQATVTITKDEYDELIHAKNALYILKLNLATLEDATILDSAEFGWWGDSSL